MNTRILLPWLFIILSAKVLLSSSAIERRIPSKQRGLGHPKHLLIQQEVHGYSNNTIVSYHRDGKGRENEVVVVDSSKAQKGKGTYGGANVAHHPRPKNIAASLSKTPYIYISATINLCVSFVWLLVPSF